MNKSDWFLRSSALLGRTSYSDGFVTMGKFLIGAKFGAENGGFMLLSWSSTGTIPTSGAGVRFAEERDENAD
jgi:hypothetical protein